MNCQKFWETIPDPGYPPGEEHAAHLQECSVCGARLEMQRTLLRGLRTLSAESRGQGAPGRVEARLLAAFRGHSGGEERPRRAWVPVLTWAMAAAVLAAIGLFLIRGREPDEPAQRNYPRRVEMASSPALVQRSTVHLASFDGDFVPLPNVAEISPDEEVNLVRLQVPGSALMALGVPIEAARAAEPVEADFVLGIDGRARAVRWVEE